MNKEREETLEKLRKIKKTAEINLKERTGYENYIVKNVIHYNKKVELVNRESGEKEEFDLCVVFAENPETKEIEEFYYLDEKEVDLEELMREYESPKPIKDVVDKTKENEKLPEEEQDKDLKTDTLEELELEKEQEKEGKETSNKEKVQDLKISNIKGEVDLDQMVDGETLRNILELGEEYDSIAPIRASTVGVISDSEYCFVAIKNDKTCTVLGDDVIREDRQKGTSPDEKDLKVNNDGSLSKESSINGFQLVNRPNLFMAVRYDKNSSTRETTISDISGRESRDKEVAKELHKDGDDIIDNDARDSLREEHGIDASDKMEENQKVHEQVGCENDRIENIDNDNNNNEHEHQNIQINKEDEVPGKQGMTFEEWSEELGENTDVIIDRFQREMEKNPNRELENIVKEIEVDYDRLQNHNI